MRLFIMPGLPMHLVQELNVDTVLMQEVNIYKRGHIQETWLLLKVKRGNNVIKTA